MPNLLADPCSKVMKLCHYVLFKTFYRFHVILLARKICKYAYPVAAAVSLLTLTTNQTEEQIHFGGLELEKWCVPWLKLNTF